MAIVHYQKRDELAFDYMTYMRSGFPIAFRGPRVPVHLADRYAVALGSAATFGRFVHQPYAEQLTLAGLPTLNLGISGARPGFFAALPDAADLFGAADALVFEIVSARGYATAFFDPAGKFSNMGTYTAPDGSQEPNTFVDKAWKSAIQDYPAEAVDAAVALSLDTYLQDFAALAALFPRRVVLLWFSQRPIDATLDSPDFEGRSGRFPHFVDAPTVQAMQRILKQASREAQLIEIVSSEGLPAPILERATGRPISIISKPGVPSVNAYYPSQDMHDTAATALWRHLR